MHSDFNSLFLNRFYCGYTYSKFQDGDLLIEENMSNDYMIHFVDPHIIELKKKLVPVFAKELNRLHHLNLTDFFWDRVLNSWFRRITRNVSFKYLRLKYVLDQVSSENLVEVNTLSEDEYIFFQEIVDFAVGEQSEKCDLQLWSQIVKKISKKKEYERILKWNDVSYGKEEVDDRFGKFQAHPIQRNLAGRTQRRCKRTFSLLQSGEFHEAINVWRSLCKELLVNYRRAVGYLYYPGFSSRLFEQIIDESDGKIQALPHEIYDKSYKLNHPRKENLNIDFRNKLKAIIISYLADETVGTRDVIEIVLDNMPMCYIEEFSMIRSQYEKYLTPNISFLLSMHGNYMCSAFLFFQAEMRERFNCQMIGIQHGGNYQVVKLGKVGMDFDESDVFYVWGRNEGGLSNHLRNSYHGITKSSAPCKFFEYSPCEVTVKKGHILFAGNAIEPYGIGNIACDTAILIDAQLDFFQQLNPNIRRNLEYRTFLYQYGWNEDTIVREKFPEIQMDSLAGRQKTFFHKMMECHLMVTDAMETVFMEALVMRKPFLIFMPSNAYLYWKEEELYLKLMREQGILHDSPKAAANLINEIYSDIDGWWNKPERKHVIEILRNRYWTDVDDTEKWWLNEILGLSAAIK